MKNIFFILIFLLITSNSIKAISETCDTTLGPKKVLKNATLYIAIINNPFSEKHYFVFDSVSNNQTLWITHWIKTNYNTYKYPKYIDMIKKNDVFKILNKYIKINSWDNFFLYYEILPDTFDGKFKKLKPIEFKKIVIPDSVIIQKLSQSITNYNDSLELKKMVQKIARNHYLFKNLNTLYIEAQKLIFNKNYSKCFKLTYNVITKKEIKFFGLIYYTAYAALQLKKYNIAYSLFENLYNLLPEHPLGLYGISLTLYNQNKLEQANFNCKLLINSFPDFILGYKLYYNILKSQEKDTKSIVKKFEDKFGKKTKINDYNFELPEKIYNLPIGL